MAKLIITRDQLDALGRDIIEIKDGQTVIDAVYSAWPEYHPSNGRVYLNGTELRPPKFEGGECIDRGDESGFTHALSSSDTLAIVKEVKGLGAAAILSIVSLVASVAIALLYKPKIPGNSGEESTSSNNSLFGQENTARLYQAIPDVYGSLKIYPDLANAEAYFEYVDNKAELLQYMVLGIGEFRVDSDIRLGSTPVDQITGAETAIYEPVAGVTTVPNYKTSSRVLQVEGQELKGTEGTIVNVGDSDVFAFHDKTFDLGRFLKLSPSASPNFSLYFDIGDTVTIENCEVITQSVGLVQLTGSYVVDDVTDRTITLEDAATVDADWNSLDGTVSESQTNDDFLIRKDAGLEVPIGPFDTGVEGDGVLVDIKFPSGLKTDATFRIEVLQIDEPGGDPLVPEQKVTENVAYSGSTFNELNRTEKIAGPQFGYFRVTVTRTNDASLDTNKPDLAKWSRLASYRDFASKTFNNGETILKVSIPQTEQAVSPRENKVNLDVTRKTITYDTGTGQIVTTLSPTNGFADAVLHMYTQSFGQPSSQLDLDGLYEIQERIGSDLAAFAFSFDDISVSLGERLEAICNCARVRPFLDGDVWRFVRDELRTDKGSLITRMDIAPEDIRDYSRSWNPRLPSDVDSVKLEYVNPETNKKAYIFRSYDGLGNIVSAPGARPYEVKLAGCQNETQAINRAEMEVRRILYERWSVSDTTVGVGSLYDIGDLIRYADTYRKDIFDGEILSINGLSATLSEFVDLEAGKNYEIVYSDSLGQFVGPYSIVNDESKSKQVTLSTGDLSDAYVRDGSLGTAIQTGSRYIISELGESDPDQYIVSQKEPKSNGTVQITMRQYDPRTYEFDS